MTGLRVVGGGVVEVGPTYDTLPGDATVIAAAETALSLIELRVATPVHSLRDAEVDTDVKKEVAAGAADGEAGWRQVESEGGRWVRQGQQRRRERQGLLRGGAVKRRCETASS